MAFVIDASLAIVWFLPDEVSASADAVLQRLGREGAIVPDLFWHEMRNVLITSYHRQRLPREDIGHSMIRLTQLDISTSATSNNDLILDLAEMHRLTAYDAAYLSLAIETKSPIATLDKRMRDAAARENVPLLFLS